MGTATASRKPLETKFPKQRSPLLAALGLLLPGAGSAGPLLPPTWQGMLAVLRSCYRVTDGTRRTYGGSVEPLLPAPEEAVLVRTSRTSQVPLVRTREGSSRTVGAAGSARRQKGSCLDPAMLALQRGHQRAATWVLMGL